jgi:hypothetical protein
MSANTPRRELIPACSKKNWKMSMLASICVVAWPNDASNWGTGLPGHAADSAETFLCSCLPAVQLVGLVPKATVGWARADPVGGPAIAWMAEGRRAC